MLDCHTAIQVSVLVPGSISVPNVIVLMMINRVLIIIVAADGLLVVPSNMPADPTYRAIFSPSGPATLVTLFHHTISKP